MKRILIVEANAGPPGSLSQLAARAFPAAQVVHTSSATAAASKMDRLVSMLLVDSLLTDGDAQGVIRSLRAQHPNALAVVFTRSADDEGLFPALREGAFGYLLRTQPAEDLVAALRQIAQGEPALAPPFSRRVLLYFSGGGCVMQANSSRASDAELNARETEVLQRVAQGYTLPEIAAQLSLSRHTVADYLKKIYRKLNVSSRAEAALEAARRGLVRP